MPTLSERIAERIAQHYEQAPNSANWVSEILNEEFGVDGLVAACEELSTAVELWGRRVSDHTPHRDEARVAMAQLLVRDALSKARGK